MKKSLCFVVTSASTVNAFLVHLIHGLSPYYEITVVCSDPVMLHSDVLSAGVKVRKAKLVRKISVFKDICSLLELISGYSSISNLEGVITLTPKAGFIGMVSAFFYRIENRVHIFTGQVWAQQQSLLDWVLKFVDNLTAILASHLIVDSHTQRDFLRANCWVRKEKFKVIGPGSICGVSLERFQRDNTSRAVLLSKLGLPVDAFLVLFVGRLVRDKGILDLIAAIQHIRVNDEKVFLLMVGSDEGNISRFLNSSDGLIQFDWTSDVAFFMSSADLLCLPSYREGFGNVVIEAAACRLPCLASNIYGLQDAVKDGQTGLLHKVRDVSDILEKLMILKSDPDLREFLGAMAYERAVNEFDSRLITKQQVEFFRAIFG